MPQETTNDSFVSVQTVSTGVVLPQFPVETLPKKADSTTVTHFTVESEHLAKGTPIMREKCLVTRTLAKGKTWTLHHVVDCQAEV